MHISKPVLNILWIIDHLGYKTAIHGAGMYILNIVPAFDPAVVQIHLGVLRKNPELEKYLAQNKIMNFYSFARKKYDPFTIFDFLSVIREKKIRIIHSHGYGSDNFGRLAGKITGVPAIIHTHDPLHYYPWVQKAADTLLAGFTRFSIAVSPSIKEIVTCKRKIKPEKITVFPTCIPLRQFSPLSRKESAIARQELEIPPGWKTVGTLGRLHQQKGMEFLLRAAPAILKDFPKTLFLIIGDGPLRDSLEGLSHLLGLSPNVKFIGYRQDVRRILGVIDIAVLPSLWEGTPIALLEAMAMGRPIVATSVGGMKAVLSHEKTALMVQPGDPEALAAAIAHLLTDKRFAARLGAASLKESRNYDSQYAATKLQKLYLRILTN
jgi:glycosyltransferase involved in cell wall biosynthesis